MPTTRPWRGFLCLAVASLLLLHPRPSSGHTVTHTCSLGFLMANNLIHYLRHNKCCSLDQIEVLELNPFIELLERLRGHRLLFIGDSTAQLNYQGLVGLLAISGTGFHYRAGVDNATIAGMPPTYYEVYVPTYNLTVASRLCYLMFPPEPKYRTPGQRFGIRHVYSDTPRSVYDCSYELVKASVKEASMVVLNMGLHYNNAGHIQGAAEPYPDVLSPVHPLIFQQMLFVYLDLLEKDMASDARKRHFYRYTFPQVYLQDFSMDLGYMIDGDVHGRRNADKRDKSVKCATSGVTFRQWTDPLAHDIVGRTRLLPLDFYHYIVENKRHVFKEDGGNVADCTHFCWNATMWRDFFGGLMLSKLVGSY